MSAFWITMVSLLRRIATVGGSAVLTFLIEHWMDWVQGGFMANPKTAAIWPIVFLLLEAIQKYWRESKKAVP